MSKLATETSVTENVDERVVAKAPSHLRVFLIALFVAFGGFLFGYDCIIGGELLDVDKFRLDFGTPQEPTGELGWKDSLRGAFVSILSAGTFFGALTASQYADRLGRKKGIIVTCCIFAVGIAIQTWAPSIAVLMVGRCIAGYGVGLVSVMIPLYQGECVPARRRGTMVSCYQLAITIGLLVGQIVVYGTKNMTSSDAYRIPIGLQFAWSGILFLGMLYFPDTPRNLVRIGKEEEAVKAKCRLTGLPPNHPEVREELAEIKGNLQHEMALGPASYKECFRGLNLRRTLLGVFMQVWQQLTGVNFVFYFGTMFFKSAGMEDPFLIAMIMGTVNCLCTFPGMWLIERIGRRKLLLWGAAIQFISQGLVGAIYQGTRGSQPIFVVVFTATFIAAFAASWGPCAWVITAELFSLKTRAKQMSFAAAGNWGFNTLLGQISPMFTGSPEKPVLGVNVAFVWMTLNIGCWLYVYFFIPELKGLQLEQVDELFEKRIPPRQTAGWVPTVTYKRDEPDHAFATVELRD